MDLCGDKKNKGTGFTAATWYYIQQQQQKEEKTQASKRVEELFSKTR